MQVIADTHVHIYPEYNFTLLIESAFKNLNALCKDAAFKVLFLTENKNNQFFPKLIAAVSDGSFANFKIDRTVDEGLIKVTNSTGDFLIIANGRQFVSKEGIEVLSLLSSNASLEGKELNQIIDAILANKGTAVLSWSPGKWTAKRGRKVLEIVEKSQLVSLMLGDITMRAELFPLPKIMRLAKDRSIRIIAGTDPLPVKGEEKLVGSYGSLFSVSDDWQPSHARLREMLSSAEFKNTGKRNRLDQAVTRWVKAKINRK